MLCTMGCGEGIKQAPVTQIPPQGQPVAPPPVAQPVEVSQPRPVRGQEVLNYLCETEEADAVALLKAVHAYKPHLLPRVMSAAGASPRVMANSQRLAVERAHSAEGGKSGNGSASRSGSKTSPAGREQPMDLLRKHSAAEMREEEAQEQRMEARTGEDTEQGAMPINSGDVNRKSVVLEEAIEEAKRERYSARSDHSLHLETAVPIMALSSHQYFSVESQEYAVIDVMRLGNHKFRSCVSYQTKDWSAVTGKQYEATSGRLTFEPGESVKEFKIKIISDEMWNTTTEFIVELLPDVENGILDQYLYTAKVKVIDDDTFPTNIYADLVKKKQYGRIVPGGLIYQYFRLNFMDPVVRKGTWKVCAVDQIHNLYFVAKLFMNVYLVDIVLRNETDKLLGGSKQGTLIWLAFSNFVFFLVTYWLDQKKFYWKVGGRSRAILQKSLLRKFLNYDEDSRDEVDQGALVMAMTRDSVNLVKEGYMNCLKLIRAFGQLFLLQLFLVTSPGAFDREYRWAQMIVPAVSLPVVLTVYLYFRMKKTTRNYLAMNDMQDELVDYVNSTAATYRLIADYNMRGKYVDTFETIINELNKRIVLTDEIIGNNLYFPKLITTLLISAYFVIGGMNVAEPGQEDGMTLGMFLSDIAVFTQVGLCWGDIYQCLCEVLTVQPPLERITTLENLPTDVAQRGVLSEANRGRTKLLRSSFKNQATNTALPIDLLPITVKDLYLKSRTKSMSRKGSLEVVQGQLVALVGRRGQGKATLLKLISGVILPRFEQGQDPGFFMPSHVRVLHISIEPLFFAGSLYDNLTFGVRKGHSDASLERVTAICRLLRLGEEVIKYIDGNEVQCWETFLSQTQKATVCLARAFITNPEVMCIHKPTQVFDPDMAVNVMRCLRKFVSRKGIEQDESTWHLRRIRTCLFTSTERMNVLLADQVIHISVDEGIRTIDKECVTDGDLC